MKISDLINKLLLRSSENEELSILEKWKQETEDSISSIKKMTDNQNFQEKFHNYQSVDVSHAWNKVDAAISKENSFWSRNKIWVFAVAALLLCLLALWYFNSRKSAPTESLYAYGVTDPVFHMSDGSVIDLDDAAVITQNGYRAISLQGKAYFKVAKDANSPFTVQTLHGEIKVLGTEFNVNTSKDSTQIYVSEGKVSHTYQGHTYLLPKGTLLSIKGNSIKTFQGEFGYLSAWRDGVLKFENASLHEVLNGIAALYDVQIIWEIKGEDLCKINTVITNEKIEDVLKELTIISGLRAEYKKGKIIVKSFKC